MRVLKTQIFWTSLVAMSLAAMALHNFLDHKPQNAFHDVSGSSSTMSLLKDSSAIR